MIKLKTSIKYSAFLLIAAFGRFSVAWLCSKKGGRNLHWETPDEHCWIKCPSGNEFYAEMDGPVNAQPLVLVHGLDANRKQWYYQRKYFNTTYRLFFIDLPGHGKSKIAKDLSLQTLAADLKTVLEHLHVKSPIIYGHSWGSSILIRYCLQYPADLNAKGVILHGGAYNNSLNAVQFAPVMKALQKPVIVPLVKLIKIAAPIFDVITWLNFSSGMTSFLARFLYFTGQQTPAQLNYVARMAPNSNTKAVAEALLQLLKSDTQAAQLKNIKVPTLVIGSVYDRLHQLKCSLFIHQQIPQSKFIVVKAGHQSLIEKHSKLNKGVEGFIRDLQIV